MKPSLFALIATSSHKVPPSSIFRRRRGGIELHPRCRNLRLTYGDWLTKSCQQAGLRPRIIKEAGGAASALLSG